MAYLRCKENQNYLAITEDEVKGITEKDEYARIKIISAGGSSVWLQGEKSGKYVGVVGDDVTLFDAEDKDAEKCTFIREDTKPEGFKLKSRVLGGKYLVLKSDLSVIVATDATDATEWAGNSNNPSDKLLLGTNVSGNRWES